jgi:hypothetical protein
MKQLLATLAILLWPSSALAAECAEGSTCVPPEDLKVMVETLKEKHCLQTEKPTFTLDSITIITDEKGRVFYTGADPNPYKLKMTWCGYEADGEGKVKVVSAMKEPETWGFRFRPKAYLGYLPAEPLFYASSARQGIDAGLMLDFFHVKFANVNVAVGFRSVGLGFGVDVTQNFGLYTGYALAWASWNHNLNSALWFAF